MTVRLLRKNFNVRYFSLLILVVVVGCRSELPRGEVEGTVTVNGRPEAGLLIIYVPQSIDKQRATRATGMTDDSGRYVLRGEDQQTGVVIGPHSVIIQDMAIYSAPRSLDGTITEFPAPRVPSAYHDLLTTPLIKTVDKGKQVIDIDLK